MLLLYPFSHKQTVSTIKQQELRPKVAKLKKKFKDKQELNQEIMKMYKEEGINPVAGCLPLVIQLPIFFSLFRLFRNIQDHIPVKGKLFSDICGSTQASKCSPDSNFFGLDLFSSLSKTDSFLTAIPYILILVALMYSAYIQVTLSAKRSPEQNKLINAMRYIAPALAGIFSISLTAALNIYLLTSSIWRFLQQEYIYRFIIPKHKNKNKKKGD
jgi:YidC/Oxa1 family membrane protein insertase